MAPERPHSSACSSLDWTAFWLVIIVPPTVFSALGLVAACVDGIYRGISGVRAAVLLVLMFAPFLVWVLAYRQLSKETDQRAYVVLHAFGAALPITLFAMLLAAYLTVTPF